MLVLAALLVGLAVVTLPPRGSSTARRRLGGLLGGHDQPDRHRRGGRGGRGTRFVATSLLSPASPFGQRLVAAFAGCCTLALVGGMVGLVVGLLVGVACERGLRRFEPAARRRRRERLTADLPVAADLLAACLRAGTSLVAAAESVATAIGGPLADELLHVVTSIRLGHDPTEAWLSLSEEQALVPLARAVARAVDTGAPLAAAMSRLAEDERAARRCAATAQAQRVGVRAVLPLGLCFLPAFILLGVLPVVGGVIGRILGS